MKVICPFCHEEVPGEDVPETVLNYEGKVIYTCHKKVCYNASKHPDHNNLTVVYKPEASK